MSSQMNRACDGSADIHVLAQKPSPWYTNCGFSLVEVAVAVSIISCGFLVVLGLLPVGLSTVRQAMDSSIERQIAQQIAAELIETPFSRLEDHLGIINYYDDQGMVTSVPAQARYRATITKVVNKFPGSFNAPAATPLENSVVMLQIQIAVAPASAVNAIITSQYNILVPNSGN